MGRVRTSARAVLRLSAIIITKDEAANIGPCLDALAFCDERIVVDGGSEDDTVEIARARGAAVVLNAWPGFGPQKNFALAQASGDWVLSVDADERVSPTLADEITRAVSSPAATHAGYKVPRLSTFLGRQMHHSGWFPDHVLRLFRRGRGRFSDDLVHERVICDGPVGLMMEPLLHHPVLRLEEAISRLDRYSTAGAQMMTQKSRRVGFHSGITHGLWTFIRIYLLKAGFLDGHEGFLLAVANAEGSYYRYMKAWLAQRTSTGRGDG